VVEQNAAATREAAIASQALTHAVEEQTRKIHHIETRLDRIENR
jgi:hypothetical protein